MKTEARIANVRAALTDALDIIGSSNELLRPVTFSVMVEDSHPHECGPMVVVLRPDGLTISWEGVKEDPWEISWRALKATCERTGELEDLEELVAEAKFELAILKGEGVVVGEITGQLEST